MRSRTGSWVVFLGGTMVLAACGGGGRDIVEPPPPSGNFVLTILASEQDASTAEKLGWTGGIPGAEVTVTPVDGSAAPRTLTSSAAGTVSISALPAGRYRVSVRRLLTASEIATLNEVSGAGAFVSESEVEVVSSSGTATVRVPASFRTSLVISEWSFQHKWIPGTGSYQFGGFLELYNNSDTTVYLDGVLIADGHAKASNVPGTFSDCGLYAPYQNDPAGVWTQWMAGFPGTGHDFPLAPGKAVVIATDAIDHRPFFADALDLRGADFEFIGSSDVDNPAVPNMIERGVREYFLGHGLMWGNSLAAVVALSLPGTSASFARANLPPNATEHIRLPRERILDLFTTISTWMSLQQPPIAVCTELVNSAMDRKYGLFMVDEPDAHLVSFSRRVLRTLPDGRHILQSTRTSANDFQRTSRTPGVVTP